MAHVSKETRIQLIQLSHDGQVTNIWTLSQSSPFKIRAMFLFLPWGSCQRLVERETEQQSPAFWYNCFFTFAGVSGVKISKSSSKNHIILLNR